MRLFIAINFEKSVIDEIIAIQNQLRNQAVKGNFTREENLHLTLVFLGAIEEKKIDLIERAMNEITIPSFDLIFNKMGHFSRDAGDIWWIGAEENQFLFDMQKKLSAYLSKLGFSIERRGFKPHLTLGREVILREKPLISLSKISSRVSKIYLMKSERINGKLTYTAIYTKEL
ncbi:RNA 2',3'-cyclic phosphodiesterase [Clostridium aminobutyricum]|uniref:RNA 2',3'-cyclic phosphodiesterase n=1 Tax=Clostridium aminobutyricum TaxID=33953 RepID=A0A939IIC9_CLOAM|nr:RNA 2',3'-cyclic phosphodiesterase [Clostridium aminobutyricum]MBN7772364.1 RNA 2',3'-cyclic phosphodiesterase [Clostridium aminobutyricum]